MRVLFDTNVLFAALISHGVCAGLYEECIQSEQIVVSAHILDELEEKLISKAKFSEAEVLEVILAVRADAESVPVELVSEPVCRNPDDDLILAAARGGKGDVIVTGDQDLLVLKEFEGIPILNPRDCLALLAKN